MARPETGLENEEEQQLFDRLKGIAGDLEYYFEKNDFNSAKGRLSTLENVLEELKHRVSNYGGFKY